MRREDHEVEALIAREVHSLAHPANHVARIVRGEHVAVKVTREHQIRNRALPRRHRAPHHVTWRPIRAAHGDVDGGVLVQAARQRAGEERKSKKETAHAP